MLKWSGRVPKPRLFIELCAGMAAVSFRLIAGHGAASEPFAGYLGGKRGYADTILSEMGLAPGDGTEELWLCDIGRQGVLWQSLLKPGFVLKVAAALKKMDCSDPKRLFEKCLEEGWTDLSDPEEVARWLWVARCDWYSGSTDKPRLSMWVYPAKDPTRKADPEAASKLAGKLVSRMRWFMCQRMGVFHCSAEEVPIVGGFGVYTYIDPPYAGTTGYGAGDLSRAKVIQVALDRARAGEKVCISEGEPLTIPGFGPGFRHLDITDRRNGAYKRSFGDTREWLTLSNT